MELETPADWIVYLWEETPDIPNPYQGAPLIALDHDFLFQAKATNSYGFVLIRQGERQFDTYTMTIAVTSGTPIDRILLGAYPDPEPYKIIPVGADDPKAGHIKPPVGGTTVRHLEKVDCDQNGNNCDLVGWFDGLRVPVDECQTDADCVPPICKAQQRTQTDPLLCAPAPCGARGYCEYYLFAFADNNQNNLLNLASYPLDVSDFVMLPSIAVPSDSVDFDKNYLLYTIGDLVINTPVTDSDFDGVANYDPAGWPLDNCPTVYNIDQRDSDNDLAGDICDNCPQFSNPDQADADASGIGDACNNDLDTDYDEYEDQLDLCVFVANPDQANFDNDSFGDSCDIDIDADGICNCVSGEDCQQGRCYGDLDQDGLPHECAFVLDASNCTGGDDCLGGFCQPDLDNDNKLNECTFDDVPCGLEDNCPYVNNPQQLDTDNDGYGEACDNCRADVTACLSQPNLLAGKKFANKTEERDKKWGACLSLATLMSSECDSLNTDCMQNVCIAGCHDGFGDCYGQASCDENAVLACYQNHTNCREKCDRFPFCKCDNFPDCQEDECTQEEILAQQACYETCDDKQRKCVDQGTCDRSALERCLTCRDECDGMCSYQYAVCMQNGVVCSGPGGTCAVPNPDQLDSDGDGLGDACDPETRSVEKERE